MTADLLRCLSLRSFSTWCDRFAQVKTRCTQLFGDFGVAAHGALHQIASELALKVVFRAKPAFKRMLLAALQDLELS